MMEKFWDKFDQFVDDHLETKKKKVAAAVSTIIVIGVIVQSCQG